MTNTSDYVLSIGRINSMKSSYTGILVGLGQGSLIEDESINRSVNRIFKWSRERTNYFTNLEWFVIEQRFRILSFFLVVYV